MGKAINILVKRCTYVCLGVIKINCQFRVTKIAKLKKRSVARGVGHAGRRRCARANYQWSILVPARLSFDRSNFSWLLFMIRSEEHRFASFCIIINLGFNPSIPCTSWILSMHADLWIFMLHTWCHATCESLIFFEKTLPTLLKVKCLPSDPAISLRSGGSKHRPIHLNNKNGIVDPRGG